jgi:hypothetical protein
VRQKADKWAKIAKQCLAIFASLGDLQLWPIDHLGNQALPYAKTGGRPIQVVKKFCRTGKT